MTRLARGRSSTAPPHPGRRRRAPEEGRGWATPTSSTLCSSTISTRRTPTTTRRLPLAPHRGIETVTYVLDGVVEHGDSIGNRGHRSGDVRG